MRLPGAAVAAAIAWPCAASAQEAAREPAAPAVALEIAERGPGSPWRAVIANRGDRDLRVATDPRLFWLEVGVPGRKKPAVCRLPDSLFPNRVDPDFRVVLKPERAYAFELDPRLYCFSSGKQEKLVPGALVTPHFGWPERTKKVWRKGRRVEVPLEQLPPFAVEPVVEAPPPDDASPPVGPAKGIAGTPLALRSSYAEWSATSLLPAEKDRKDEGPLRMRMTRGSDARAERAATVAVRIRNRSKRSLRVYLRRELVSFEVMGPDGLTVCNPQPDDRAPDRAAFLRLRRGGGITLTSRLVELCPRGTFGRPGLYLVNAWLDATDAGRRFGLDAFVGRIATRTPVTVRIRTGEKPFHKAKEKRKPWEKGATAEKARRAAPPPLGKEK